MHWPASDLQHFLDDDGVLDIGERRALAGHLGSCDACRVELAELEAIGQWADLLLDAAEARAAAAPAAVTPFPTRSAVPPQAATPRPPRRLTAAGAASRVPVVVRNNFRIASATWAGTPALGEDGALTLGLQLDVEDARVPAGVEFTVEAVYVPTGEVVVQRRVVPRERTVLRTRGLQLEGRLPEAALQLFLAAVGGYVAGQQLPVAALALRVYW